jgi:hypothetical protein
MDTDTTGETRTLFAHVPTELAGWFAGLAYARRESKTATLIALLEQERANPRLPPPGPPQPEPEPVKRKRGRPRKAGG